MKFRFKQSQYGVCWVQFPAMCSVTNKWGLANNLGGLEMWYFDTASALNFVFCNKMSCRVVRVRVCHDLQVRPWRKRQLDTVRGSYLTTSLLHGILFQKTTILILLPVSPEINPILYMELNSIKNTTTTAYESLRITWSKSYKKCSFP